MWFLATVNRIADILAAQGDLDPVGVRRARAVGILARPAEALQLLIDHQHGAEQPHQPDAPVEPEPAGPDEPVDDHVSLSSQAPAGFGAKRPDPKSCSTSI